jgi:hypothetical protein
MSLIRDAFRNDETPGKWIIGGVVCVMGVVAAILIYIAYSVLAIGDSVRRIDALHYPVPQIVDNRLTGVDYDGPALRLGDYVRVTGTKCSDAASPIVTFGVTTQSLIDPGGIHATQAIAANLRLPGCETKTYSNALDPALVDRIKTMFSGGVPFVVMKITGFESPVDQHYSSAEWYTQEFRVYPPTHPLGPGPRCCSVTPSSQASPEETP